MEPSLRESVPVADGIEIVSFGCRLNLWESAIIRQHARGAGLRDTIVVNTCAVTAEAERQARQSIRRLRRERPRARLVVTGCSAQIAPERWAAMAEVDQVLGNAEKLSAGIWRRSASLPRVQVGDAAAMIDAVVEPIADIAGHSRGFLQVQNGCDHRCTFCTIPLGRGPSRSLPAGDVVSQIRTLVSTGHREVVLSGVDLTAWGNDLPARPTLGALARRILRLVPELPRLRLSSLDPVEIDEDLLALLGEEPRLMPHLHLSVQSGNDLILKRMRRRHSAGDVLRLVERARARRPDVVFGADLIAGFPTETETMFTSTVRLVEQAGLTWLHVFPYSERPGTPAARMPAVAKAERRARAAQLRIIGKSREMRFLRSQIGREAEILVELDGSGHSEHFAPVRPAMPLAARTLARVQLTKLENGVLIGEMPTANRL